MSPVPPSSSARAARETVAGRLREIRRDAELTGEQLAVRCGWSKSKSSRIENGVTPPSPADIRMWCAVCGAVDQAADLIAASRTADSMYMEWRRQERTGLRRLQEARLQLYRETRLYRAYSPDVVPGLLQTPAYATALLAAITRFRGIPDDVAEAVEARMRRPVLFWQGGGRCAVLIEEAVLHYRIGDVTVMREQLAELRAATQRPAVALGVIPSGAARPMWPIETFTAFDDQQVHVETLSASLTITQPGEVALYVRAFGELQALAVYGGEARHLIERAAAHHDQAAT